MDKGSLRNMKKQAIGDELSRKISNAGFVCALLVVAIHIWTKEWSPANTLARCLLPVSSIAVPTFFAISGYLLGGGVPDKGWWGRALRSRLISLGIPCLVWSSVWAAYLLFVDVPWRQGGILRFAGINFCRPPQLKHLWYLRTLFVFVGLSPFLIMAIKRWPKLFLCALAVGIVVPQYDEESLFGYFVFEVLGTRSIFYFAFGLCCRINKICIEKLPKWWFVSGILGIVLSEAGVFYDRYLLVRLSAPLAVCFLWEMIPNRKWPEWLVRTSFPIYLMHWIALDAFNRIVVCSDIFYRVSSVVEYVIRFLVGTVVPICIAFVMRRTVPAIYKLVFGGR